MSFLNYSGSICHHVVWQPVSCGTQKGCQTAFCSSCIDAWLKKCHSQDSSRPLCPHCKRPFARSCIPPILKSVLERIRLRCPHNSKGCRAVLSYNEVALHLSHCIYKGTNLSNKCVDAAAATHNCSPKTMRIISGNVKTT